MRKRFKTKKNFKLKNLIYLLIILIVAIILNLFSNIKFDSNTNIVENTLNLVGFKKLNILSNLSNFINKNIFNSPDKILKSQILYDKKDSNHKEDIEQVNFSYNQNKLPKVYLYNTHQGETYSKEYLENSNINPTILMATLMFKDKLENININTLVEESDILEYMKKNNYNHAKSYIASRYFLSNTINKYNSIQLYIDVHRDAALKNVTTTNINNKACARILFVVGLENSNYKKNLDTTNKINNMIKSKYPTLTRGIMKKEGYGVNGVYNQDLNDNIILLELGGNNNNIDEVSNTLDLIVPIIGEYLNEKKE